jgi:hypothetical protein
MGVVGKRHVPASLSPGKILRTHCTESWVVLGAGLNYCRTYDHHRDSNPEPSNA